MSHTITNAQYHIRDIETILVDRQPIELSPEVRDRIAAGHQFVLRKAEEGSHIYGVNTGFGAMCEVSVPKSDMHALQRNLILSHACGVGELADEDTCRMTMLLKLLTFRSGHTGISLQVVDRLVEFWNAGAIPATPSKGTLGASGDLAPLAHMSLPLLGMGEVYLNGELTDASVVLRRFGWQPLELGPKEGLALINGVQYITAVAACSLLQAERLLIASEVIASISVQAFCASRTFFHGLYHSVTAHTERRVTAQHLSLLTEGSNHWDLAQANRSMQDPYSFRCIPQINGAIRQALGFVQMVVEAETNTVGDNPLFFPAEDEVLFGGNLHGESTAMALDFAAIACSELGSASERRTYQLLSGQRGLPDFLVRNPGLNSGFMIAQYTAAALVNENKIMATPSSIDTIMSSQLQEDHVSMGGTGATKLRTVLRNCETIIAIELLVAAQAMELQENLVASAFAKSTVEELRNEVPFLSEDRVLAHDFVLAEHFVRERNADWLAAARRSQLALLDLA